MGRGRDDGPDRRPRLRGLRDRPRGRPEDRGRRRPREARLPEPAPGHRRHPLQRLARAPGDRRGRRRRADQPGEHRRARQGRGGRARGQGEGHPDADRRQLRLAPRAPEAARPARHRAGARPGGARAGRAPRAPRLPRLQDLGQVELGADDDPRLPDALREGALPAPPRGDRGGDALHRLDQERRRDGQPPHGRDRRHDARLAHRRPGRGGQGRLGDPEGARPARARPRDDRLPVLRARQRGRAPPRRGGRGAAPRLSAGLRGRGDGVRGERTGGGGRRGLRHRGRARDRASSTRTAAS